MKFSKKRKVSLLTIGLSGRLLMVAPVIIVLWIMVWQVLT